MDANGVMHVCGAFTRFLSSAFPLCHPPSVWVCGWVRWRRTPRQRGAGRPSVAAAAITAAATEATIPWAGSAAVDMCSEQGSALGASRRRWGALSPVLHTFLQSRTPKCPLHVAVPAAVL